MNQPKPDMIRLLLVDDHEIVRVGLRMLLRHVPGVEVVGEAEDAASALSEAIRLRPDVVLMDVCLPDGSGVEVCREIRADCPDTKVLFLTAFADEEAVSATILAGANGYLLKQIGQKELVRAIVTVANGQSVLDPVVTEPILSRMRAVSSSEDQSGAKGLSIQEQRIVQLVAEGKTNKEIAVVLGISDKTVRNHLSRVFQRFELTSRAQAAVLFARRPAQ